MSENIGFTDSKDSVHCKKMCLIVWCPGTQSFQLYAKVSFLVPIGG